MVELNIFNWTEVTVTPFTHACAG